MHVLRKLVDAVEPDGLVFDLQVIRPNPTVEVDGRFVCEIDGEPLFHTADAATAAVEALIRAGRLLEEAVDDHDVLEHYRNGADLVEDWARSERRPIGDGAALLPDVLQPCIRRERCRLRRLRVDS